MSDKIGVLLIGANGSNGQLFTRTVEAMKSGAIRENYGVTSLPIFDQDKLCKADSLVVSGWDVRGEAIDDLLPGHSAVGYRSAFDSAIGDEENWYNCLSFGDSVERVRDQISHFLSIEKLYHCVVVNLSTPSGRTHVGLGHASIADLYRMPMSSLPSSLIYMIGSVGLGCSYVDFTPSETLEVGNIREFATEHGAQIAGRDGSTGQTWLKLSVAAALLVRNFSIIGWHSSNVLGNRDGLALMDDVIAETKIIDKSHGLNLLDPRVASNHSINIEYMPILSDIKESWDLLEFEDCFGNQGSLRMNWRAQDSPLAVQVLFDIVRLIVAGVRDGKNGIRTDLGLFFKNPIACDEVSPVRLFERLVAENSSIIRDAERRRLW